MTNSLTGDYDVVLEVSLDALNRILAALHEVGSEPHSFTWKIPRTSVDFPSGLAEVQVSTPTVKIQEQWQGYDFAPYTNRITAYQRIMIYYILDPHSPPMPEFIHGDLEITVNVAVKSLSHGSGLDKMFRKVLNVDLSSNNVQVSFKPIWTSTPIDQKQTNWLIQYITEFLATKINPINVRLPPSFQNLKNVEVDFNEAEHGNIWDAWYDYSGGWHKQKINTPNTTIRAPFAASDVFVSVYNPGTGNDSQQHFVYVDKNGNIWDVFYDYQNGSGSWNLQQINKGVNSRTQGPPAVGDVFVSVFNPGGGDNQQHFTYLDKNGTIWDAWYSFNDGWHLQNICSPGNNITARPATGHVFVSVYNPGTGNDSQQHFTYLDKDGSGTIWDVFYDYQNGSGSWHLQNICSPGNNITAPPAVGDVFVSVFNPGGGDNQQHFTYLDKNLNIWDVWYDYSNGWHLQNICSPGNNITAPPAVGDVFVSIFTPGTGNDSQQHFTYPDENGNIWDVYYDYSNGWHLQNICSPGNNITAPPAVGDVFVSIFTPGTGNDSQQHFTYPDENGNIWDVYYDYSNGWHLQQINTREQFECHYGTTRDWKRVCLRFQSRRRRFEFRRR